MSAAQAAWAPLGKRTPVARSETDHRQHGRVVVVTGASSGLGAVVAAELAGRGAAVVMGVRDRRLLTGVHAAAGAGDDLDAARERYLSVLLAGLRHPAAGTGT